MGAITKPGMEEGLAAGPTRASEESAQAERTSATVDGQVFQAYRRFCFWLGHFYAVLTLARWLLVQPANPWRVPVLESSVLMLLVYGIGLCLKDLARWLGDLENVGLLVVAILLGNNALLVAWAPREKQIFNFLLLLVAVGVAFRSLWRFVFAQAMCLVVASAAIVYWIDLSTLSGYAFEGLSALLVSALIWVYLNRLVLALARIRAKDRVVLRQRRRLITELRLALSSVRTLRGLIPICAHCKRVRDDQGFWQQVEAYVDANTHAKFSHGICPACMVDVKDEIKHLGATWKPTRVK